MWTPECFFFDDGKNDDILYSINEEGGNKIKANNFTRWNQEVENKIESGRKETERKENKEKRLKTKEDKIKK